LVTPDGRVLYTKGLEQAAPPPDGAHRDAAPPSVPDASAAAAPGAPTNP